jgi:uncharacterized membrane protein YgdD (TMEM256/DUF423 family)
VAAGLAVALGAFGAHGLRASVEPRLLEVYNTGVHYHMSHALGLLAVGLCRRLAGGRGPALAWAGGLFLAGILLFSGSLYAMALTGVRALGMVTPFGGVAFILGWLALALAVWPRRAPD